MNISFYFACSSLFFFLFFNVMVNFPDVPKLPELIQAAPHPPTLAGLSRALGAGAGGYLQV